MRDIPKITVKLDTIPPETRGGKTYHTLRIKDQEIITGEKGCGKSYESILIIEQFFRDGLITKEEKEKLLQRGFVVHLQQLQQQKSVKEEISIEPRKIDPTFTDGMLSKIRKHQLLPIFYNTLLDRVDDRIRYIQFTNSLYKPPEIQKDVCNDV